MDELCKQNCLLRNCITRLRKDKRAKLPVKSQSCTKSSQIAAMDIWIIFFIQSLRWKAGETILLWWEKLPSN